MRGGVSNCYDTPFSDAAKIVLNSFLVKKKKKNAPWVILHYRFVLWFPLK